MNTTQKLFIKKPSEKQKELSNLTKESNDRSSIDSLRGCYGLLLYQLFEPEDNALCLVVLETSIGDEISDKELELEENEVIRDLLRGSKPIDHYEGDKIFSLVWDTYIAYSVIDESYSNGESQTTKQQSSSFMVYEQSNFLNYLKQATFATSDYPGAFKHYALYCDHHTINVASQDAPQIQIRASLQEICQQE